MPRGVGWWCSILGIKITILAHSVLDNATFEPLFWLPEPSKLLISYAAGTKERSVYSLMVGRGVCGLFHCRDLKSDWTGCLFVASTALHTVVSKYILRENMPCTSDLDHSSMSKALSRLCHAGRRSEYVYLKYFPSLRCGVTSVNNGSHEDEGLCNCCSVLGDCGAFYVAASC